MNGKTHPLSILLGLVLILTGGYLLFMAYQRFDTLINDFSYIVLNIFLFLNLFGLSFLWIGLGKLHSMTVTEDSLTKKYLFGLIKKNYSFDAESQYLFHLKNYYLFKYKTVIIQNSTKQQIHFSNFNIWNFNEIQNYIKDKLKRNEIKFRLKSSDKILIFSHLMLFAWLILSSILNLTF